MEKQKIENEKKNITNKRIVKVVGPLLLSGWLVVSPLVSVLKAESESKEPITQKNVMELFDKTDKGTVEKNNPVGSENEIQNETPKEKTGLINGIDNIISKAKEKIKKEKKTTVTITENSDYYNSTIDVNKHSLQLATQNTTIGKVGIGFVVGAGNAERKSETEKLTQWNGDAGVVVTVPIKTSEISATGKVIGYYRSTDYTVTSSSETTIGYTGGYNVNVRLGKNTLWANFSGDALNKSKSSDISLNVPIIVPISVDVKNGNATVGDFKSRTNSSMATLRTPYGLIIGGVKEDRNEKVVNQNSQVTQETGYTLRGICAGISLSDSSRLLAKAMVDKSDMSSTYYGGELLVKENGVNISISGITDKEGNAINVTCDVKLKF